MTVPGLGSSQDLHDFVSVYERSFPEDVLDITEPVPDSQDVTSVVWRLSAASRHPMLRFRNIEGIRYDVVTNLFACRRRISRMLGADPRNLHETFQAKARNLIEPVEVGDAPVLDRVREGEAIDLRTFPLLSHFATDRAPYITSGIIVAEEADGVGNLSYHRAMVHSPTEFATSLHSRGDLWRMLKAAADRAEPLRVAFVLGGHPLLMLAASARVPMTVDERHVAGGLFGAPLEVVRSPRYGIRVPATSDFLFEGVIDPGVRVDEGPFGEFTGYSSDRSTNSLFRVETMSRRRDPLLLDVVGGNSNEHLNLARIPRESEMAEKLKGRFPGVMAVHYPNSGSHFHCYVKLRQRRVGEARQVMLGLLGWDPYLKTVIAVDEDIDVTDDSEVLWALATHFQPADDLFVVDGLPGSPLDPSSSVEGTTSRLALDATRGPNFSGVRIGFSDESLERADRLISDRLSF
ncbi:MAG: UbiD family decarboxylase [bacterium]|nr:UbiD family decarboxylase [bacterium]MDE0289680.1 UbiD family decarboxylase [bacterium]MDE0440202.1 UbiD family decarboxylase [bacterium]